MQYTSGSGWQIYIPFCYCVIWMLNITYTQLVVSRFCFALVLASPPPPSVPSRLPPAKASQTDSQTSFHPHTYGRCDCEIARAVEMGRTLCVRLSHLSEAIMRCVLCARISFQAMPSNLQRNARGSGKGHVIQSSCHEAEPPSQTLFVRYGYSTW